MARAITTAVVVAMWAGWFAAGDVTAIRAQAAMTNVTDSRGRYPVTRVAGDPPEWRLDSIATLRDPAGSGFRGLRSILLDPDGTTWIADFAAKAIRHYSGTGAYLGTAGSVPAAVVALGGIGWAGHDLLVDDPGAGRVVRWSRAGVRNGEWVTSRLRGGDDVRLYPAGDSSSWLFQAVPRGEGRSAIAFIRLPAIGNTDTVVVPPLRPLEPVATARCPVAGGQRTFVSPFAPEYRIVPTAGGRIVILDEAVYHLVILSPAGDTNNVFERPVTPAPVTDADWARETADYVRTRRRAGRCAGDLVRAAVQPAARALTIDDQGRFWVERVVADGTTWEIWNQSDLVASVRGPRRATDVAVDVRGDRIAMARAGPDGSYSVVVYRVRTP